MKKRIFSLATALAMCLSLVPATALASETAPDAGVPVGDAVIVQPNAGGNDSTVDPNAGTTGETALNAENFPDPIFLEFVKSYDTDQNGSLSAAEIDAVTEMDCSGRGISSLVGIKSFTKLINLDCSRNQLVALDLTGLSVEQLNADDNIYMLPALPEAHTLDMTAFKDFDAAKASDWRGGQLSEDGKTLTFEQRKVRYSYQCNDALQCQLILMAPVGIFPPDWDITYKNMPVKAWPMDYTAGGGKVTVIPGTETANQLVLDNAIIASSVLLPGENANEVELRGENRVNFMVAKELKLKGSGTLDVGVLITAKLTGDVSRLSGLVIEVDPNVPGPRGIDTEADSGALKPKGIDINVHGTATLDTQMIWMLRSATRRAPVRLHIPRGAMLYIPNDLSYADGFLIEDSWVIDNQGTIRNDRFGGIILPVQDEATDEEIAAKIKALGLTGAGTVTVIPASDLEPQTMERISERFFTHQGVMLRETDLSLGNENVGDLETDGYHWDAASNTLQLKNVFGSIDTEPRPDFTIEVQGVNASRMTSPMPAAVQVKGDGVLHMTDLMCNDLTVAAGTTLAVSGRALAGAVQVNGTLMAGGGEMEYELASADEEAAANDMDLMYRYGADRLPALICRQLTIASGGQMEVTNAKGVLVLAMALEEQVALGVDLMEALPEAPAEDKGFFKMEKGAKFTGNGTDFNILVIADSAKEAAEAISIPAGYLPKDYEIKTLQFENMERPVALNEAAPEEPGPYFGMVARKARTPMNHPEYGLLGAGGNLKIEEPYRGGGGGGSSSITKYSITVEPSENGSVMASAAREAYGRTVQLTVKPDAGCELSGLKVVAKESGKAVDVLKKGGQYSFEMPAEAVVVSASFRSTFELNMEDVGEDVWYRGPVEFVVENGIMKGVSGNRFAPLDDTTRAMIVTTLYRMEKEPAVEGTLTFKDVAEGQWYTEAIRWAAANGIVKGYSAETFGPADPITREQMAAILYRYAEYKGYDLSSTSELAQFTDRDAVGDWALQAMQWANTHGLITGVTDTTILPQGEASRAEVAAILMRFCQKLVK